MTEARTLVEIMTIENLIALSTLIVTLVIGVISCRLSMRNVDTTKTEAANALRHASAAEGHVATASRHATTAEQQAELSKLASSATLAKSKSDTLICLINAKGEERRLLENLLLRVTNAGAAPSELSVEASSRREMLIHAAKVYAKYYASKADTSKIAKYTARIEKLDEQGSFSDSAEELTELLPVIQRALADKIDELSETIAEFERQLLEIYHHADECEVKLDNCEIPKA